MKLFKVMGFCALMGSVLASSAIFANEDCRHYLLPPERRQVRDTVRKELDAHKHRTLDKVVRILRSDKRNAEKKVQIVNALKSNFYFESVLPVFVMEVLVDNWLAAAPQPNGWKVLADVKEEIIRRRQVHWRGMADMNFKHIEELEFIDVIRNRLKLVRHQSEYDLYSMGPIRTIKELMSLAVMLANIWPRSFQFNQMAPVRVIQLEVEQLPGVYIYYFNDHVTMNWAFQRASLQIERSQWPTRGNDIFGTVAGGHDLKGSDLLRYLTLADQEMKKDLKASLDHSYRRRLYLEREFLASEVRPKILASPDQEVVFLAVPSAHATLSTLSHEVWHGLYFTNSAFANWCRAYWAQLSPSDRDLFVDMAAGYGYKLAEDQDHAANEFQAFMLQLDAEVAPNPLVEKESAVLAHLRPAFLKALSVTPFARLLE